MNSFAEITATLVYALVIKEGFSDTFKQIVQTTEDWPDNLTKALAKEYFGYLETNGHHYAQHMLLTKLTRLEQLIDKGLPFEARVLREEYDRQLKRHRSERLAYGILENLDNAPALIERYNLGTRSRVKLKTIQENVREYLVEREKKIQDNTVLRVLKNFPVLSKGIGGFNPGRVGILMADTGFGKTNLGLNFALDAADVMPTAYFNMEMIPYDFTERSVVALTHTPFHSLYCSEFNLHLLESKIRGKDLLTSDGRDLSVEEIRSALVDASRTRPLGMCVIDYDQKIALRLDKNTPEWKALQNAIIFLEAVAKELNLYILVLAQSNEDGGISGSRRAMFSASTVLRFFRDEAGQQIVIQAVKNRFGERNFAVSVDYLPQISNVAERNKTIVTSNKEFFA